MLFFLSFFACHTGESPPTNEIRISLPTEPPTLDWNLATDNVSYQILNQLMEGLTQFDENLKVIPAIAESWRVTDGGKTYIFTLNKNFLWSDGRPVTANNFRDSWLRLLNPETAAEYAYFLFDIKGAREYNAGKLTDPNKVGIEVLDHHTLKVALNTPVVFFPSITTFMVTFPVRLDLINKYGDHWTDPDKMVACGPYLLKEWWHEYRLILEKNPHYGGKPKPQIEQIKIFLVSDPSTALSLYESGKLDLVSPPPLALPHYQNHPDRIRHPKLRGTYYGFNIHKKPFDNPLIRKALAMALDKREIPPILKGGEKAVNSWIPPGMFGFDDDIGNKFDLEGARTLLNKHCHSEPQAKNPVGSLGVPMRSFATAQDDNQPCAPLSAITLTFNDDPINKKLAEWAQGQWKKNLGLDVILENQEWKSYLAMLRDDPPPLFRLGWGADYPDPDNFMNLFTSYSGNNHTGWKNEKYDALISRGAMERNPVRRKKIYDKAQKILLEDETVIIPLFVSVQNMLVRERLRPYPMIPMDFVYYKRVGIN